MERGGEKKKEKWRKEDNFLKYVLDYNKNKNKKKPVTVSRKHISITFSGHIPWSV